MSAAAPLRPGALYSPALLGLAVELAEYPLKDDMALRGEARSRSCGSTLQLGCTTDDDGAIAELGMRVSACAVGQASAAIFAFLTSSNEFACPSQLTRSVGSKTMPVGLLDFTAEFTINWGGMCALAVLMIVPALNLTFPVQKYLIAGLTFGGVKG